MQILVFRDPTCLVATGRLLLSLSGSNTERAWALVGGYLLGCGRRISVQVYAACVQAWKSWRHFYACVSVCNLHMQISFTGMYSCMKTLSFMLLFMLEDMTGTEWRSVIWEETLQPIISIISSSSGRRSAECVTCLCFSGYVPVRAKWMMKWSQMGKEQNSFLRKKENREERERESLNVRQSHRRVHHFIQ